MNVVFLDVDGVLTHENFTCPDTCDIDIYNVKQIAKLCKDCNASVVITSSWRGFGSHTPKCYYRLLNILKKYQIPLTEQLPPRGNLTRAEEVCAYLQNHSINNFVILDDEDFEWKKYGLQNNWVKTEYYDFRYSRFRLIEMSKAFQILNGDDDF